MNTRTLLRTSLAGTIVAAIHCATPVLVVVLYAWRRDREETACCNAAGRGEGSMLGERP